MNLFQYWSKWILVEKNVSQIKEIYASPILGSYLISKNHILVDIYRKENKRTGKVKYRKVEK